MNLTLSGGVAQKGLGWQRDLPDVHDLSIRHNSLQPCLEHLRRIQSLPSEIDWREFCWAVDDQGEYDTSPAFACAGLLEFCERRSSGRILDPSRLFIHQTTRRMSHAINGAGASLRSTLQSIVRFGVASERAWPSVGEKLDVDPDAFAFACADPYDSMKYIRLDQVDLSGDKRLTVVKAFLAAGHACVFGFPVYDSVGPEPDVSFPTQANQMLGGQAVMAVGYSDDRRYRSDRGAILFKNSWGRAWGEDGFGWLPYQYVRQHLAADFWVILRADWLQSGEFRLPDSGLV